MHEAEFIEALRTLPMHPAARGLVDDSAVLVDGRVLTTDMIVEGVHFLPDDTPADVAWKLLAVNLSDLAAKGAKPEGVLIGYMLSPDEAWNRAFVEGLGEALRHYSVPLLGGDTVSAPGDMPRSLSLTALGKSVRAPHRDGAQAGNALWVTGTLGDAGAGLAIAKGGTGPAALVERYRRPMPRVAEGQALARQVHAMMDVSDGLLIDAARMAAASGVAVTIDIATLPLSPELVGFVGDGREARLEAATAGDDYELLFALPDGAMPAVPATRVGVFSAGEGLSLVEGEDNVPMPEHLGFEHG
ncbi:thiamine-phosphate kinase [Stakelama tenebrarum]|uniref:Thiamine-monophosphate kinase n=1 Tax=Stakelama tenebrarum TaxID=2711215 RepID=A0A6G6Y383_9SPHN|nr:thiamine-phosphate kinase [Sphingosinithalassobacter tenebrarum]QIG79178.1 thiamine-phosphate kinase [Sphingosinithalassobacter tenebrarum]